MLIMASTNKGGGTNDLRRFELASFPISSAIDFMSITAKESRKQRRAATSNEETHRVSSGMDLLPFSAATWRQDEMWRTIDTNTITIAHGAAGTGKTLLAQWKGLTGVKDGKYERVYYVRSDVGVEFQRGRGALPGDFNEKVRPLIGPVLDNLPVMTRSRGAAEYLINKEIICPILLEDIRGRSLNEAFVILDEAQNLLPSHCKTVMTRLGSGSKMAVIGDTRQTDLEVFRRDNGLLDAVHRLRDLREVGIVQFEKEDIVRNSVIAHILDRYDD